MQVYTVASSVSHLCLKSQIAIQSGSPLVKSHRHVGKLPGSYSSTVIHCLSRLDPFILCVCTFTYLSSSIIFMEECLHCPCCSCSVPEEVRHAYLTVPQLQFVMQQIAIVIEVRYGEICVAYLLWFSAAVNHTRKHTQYIGMHEEFSRRTRISGVRSQGVTNTG